MTSGLGGNVGILMELGNEFATLLGAGPNSAHSDDAPRSSVQSTWPAAQPHLGPKCSAEACEHPLMSRTQLDAIGDRHRDGHSFIIAVSPRATIGHNPAMEAKR